MANPIQQGLKPHRTGRCPARTTAAMANPIQQGLKQQVAHGGVGAVEDAAMANPIQQGLKLDRRVKDALAVVVPQWLIQYNKD